MAPLTPLQVRACAVEGTRAVQTQTTTKICSSRGTGKRCKQGKKGSNIASECIAKWVKNCSDRLLNDSELSVLVKGLNFAVTSTESACRKLAEGDASELRAKVVNILSHPNARNIDSNLSNDERKALQQLQKDKDFQILPADKGRLVVVLNTVDYHSKCEKLLGDSKTYKNLGTKNPTSKYKKELVSVL